MCKENKNKQSEVDLILQLHHPIIDFLREVCDIKYNFYITSFNDLKVLLNARSFEPINSKKEVVQM